MSGPAANGDICQGRGGLSSRTGGSSRALFFKRAVRALMGLTLFPVERLSALMRLCRVRVDGISRHRCQSFLRTLARSIMTNGVLGGGVFRLRMYWGGRGVECRSYRALLGDEFTGVLKGLCLTLFIGGSGLSDPSQTGRSNVVWPRPSLELECQQVDTPTDTVRRQDFFGWRCDCCR